MFWKDLGFLGCHSQYGRAEQSFEVDAQLRNEEAPVGIKLERHPKSRGRQEEHQHHRNQRSRKCYVDRQRQSRRQEGH